MPISLSLSVRDNTWVQRQGKDASVQNIVGQIVTNASFGYLKRLKII